MSSKTMSADCFRKVILPLMAMLFVASCGGGDDSSEADAGRSPSTDPIEVTLSGSVGDGPITGATVTVTTLAGKHLQSQLSDSAANYKLKVKAKRADYPLVLRAIGGTDLVSGTGPDFALMAVVMSPSEKSTINLSPLTTLITKLSLDMPGGLTTANLEAASAIVVEKLNFGLDLGLVPDPMTAQVDPENVANVIKTNEAFGEAIRRTRDALLPAGTVVSADHVLDLLAGDLVDRVVDGVGLDADPSVSATFIIVSGQVLVESMANRLSVNGADASGLMDAAINTVEPGATDTTAEVATTKEMLAQARLAVEGARLLSHSPALGNVATALEDLTGGLPLSDVLGVLPSQSSTPFNDAISLVTIASPAQLEAVNALGRNQSGVSNRGDDKLWRYYKGTQEPPLDAQGRSWTDPDYDYSNWELGCSGIGYGDEDDCTSLDDMQYQYGVVYARHAFHLDPTTVDSMTLDIDYDDGFVAYLDGYEIARANVSGSPPLSTTLAAGGHEAGTPELFLLDAATTTTALGTRTRHVLAVQGHNISLSSSDFSLAPVLSFAARAGQGNDDKTNGNGIDQGDGDETSGNGGDQANGNDTTDGNVDPRNGNDATEDDANNSGSDDPNPPTHDLSEEQALPTPENSRDLNDDGTGTPSENSLPPTTEIPAAGSSGGSSSGGPQTADKYLAAAIRFADIVLSEGRDTYGPKKTPLFVDALSVIDHTPYRWKNRLQRTNQDLYPSEWISADFSIQQTLQATLRELSKVSGDPKYERAARDAAAYVLSNLTYNTVPPWGMHQTYDALNDVRVGLAPGDRTNPPLHEIHSVVPEYLYLASINSNAVRNYITTYVNSSMQQWSGLTFTRHVGYSPNASVFDKVSQVNRSQKVPFQGPSNMNKWHYQMALIQQGVEYSLLYGDERAWTMAAEIIKRNIAMRGANGLGPHSYEYGDPNNMIEVTSIRDDRYESMPKLLMYLGNIVGPTTTKGRWLINVALDELKAWKRGALISGTSNYRQQFGSREIEAIPQQVLWEYAFAYRLTQDPDMWDAARDIIRGYGVGDIGTRTGEDRSVSGTYSLQPLRNADDSDQRTRNRPNNFNAFTINALVELYWATNDTRFLDMAENAADVIMYTLYDNGLFVRQENGLYGRTGDFMPLALVNLSAARRGIQMDKESIIARDAYLRVPHDTTAWWNGNDKVWDNEIVYCRDKSTNVCK